MLNKVLIIEDDASLRDSIVQTLELENLEPIPTSTFTQARRTIRSNFKGVILSDIKMPEVDGFEILNFVRHKDDQLPIILLTGFSDVKTAIRAVREGAYDYLEKPCNPETLIDTLTRALKHRELVLENRQYKEAIDTQTLDLQNGSLSQQLEIREREIIEEALKVENGKVSEAAKRLEIPRNTLYDKIARHGIVVRNYR